jgi:hypothetical protein
MAVNDAIPGMPKIPTTTVVKMLIGMCNPNEAPKRLKKNKNRTPIVTLIALCPISFVKLIGIPFTRRRTIKTIIPPIIHISICLSPLYNIIITTICRKGKK